MPFPVLVGNNTRILIILEHTSNTRILVITPEPELVMTQDVFLSTSFHFHSTGSQWNYRLDQRSCNLCW